MKNYNQYMKWIIAFVFGAALIAVYKTFDNMQHVFAFIGEVFSALTPFITGFVIAYILNLPCKKLEKLYGDVKIKFIKEKNKSLAIISVYVVFILLVFIAGRTVIPRLYNNVMDLYNNIIPFTQTALAEVERLQERLGITILEINRDTAKNAVQGLLNAVNPNELGKYAKGAISFTSGLLNVFIGVIVSIYMLIDRERLIAGMSRLLSLTVPKKKEERVKRYLSRINKIFANYIYSCVLDAFIVAVLATIILSIIGIKYALIFGTLIGVCNLIPYFGAIVSNVVTVIFTFFSSGPIKAIWTLVGLLVLGQADGNIIGPKIMGNKLEVRPLLIIFAVTLGGGLFGIVGMLLSVPVMTAIKMIVSEAVYSLEEKKRERESI